MRGLLLALLLLGGAQATSRQQAGPHSAARPVAATVKAVTAVILPNMPLVRQGYNQCGPASLQMVLAYWGYGLDQAVIGAQTKPGPRAYMGVDAIGRFAALYGFGSLTVHGATVNMVRQLLAQGVPVIALNDYDQVGAVPHWRVISGFDDARRVFYVHDPLAGYVALQYRDFELLGADLGRVVAALYPPAYMKRIETVMHNSSPSGVVTLTPLSRDSGVNASEHRSTDWVDR